MRRSITSMPFGAPSLAGVGLVAAVLAATSIAAAAEPPASGTPEETWHKDGPGGAQYVDGYDLTRVFSDTGVWYNSFAPEPDARSFLALTRVADPKTGETVKSTIVRLTPDASGRLRPAKVFDFRQLRDPGLWSDGTDLDGASIEQGPGNGGASAISVAPGGDILIAASAQLDGNPGDQTLVRLTPDGSLQKVVSSADLVTADIFGKPVVAPWVVATAATDDRLYGRAEGWDGASDQFERLVQIVDPNGDGDWSDRVIRPIVLPDTVPHVEDGVYDWFYGGFVPVPIDSGVADPEATPASVLLPVFSRSEYRVYRLTDLGDDGVFTEPGEAELVFSGEVVPGSLDAFNSPRLAVVPDASGSPTLALAGLTNSSRVSVMEDGVVRDLVRGLFAPSGLVALADGSILVGNSEESSRGPGRQPYSILRLMTRAPSAEAAAGAASSVAAVSPGRSIIPRGSISAGVPRISVWVWATSPKGDDVEMQLLYGADGSGPRDVLPGFQTLWSTPCRSADGSMAVAWAEVDVPNEQPLYLFDTSGSTPPVMVTEENGTVYCPFPDDALAIASEGDIESRSISRLDLASDFTATPLVEIRQGLCAAVTDDGRYLAVASGDGTDLSLVDVVEGSVQPLAEGLDGTVVRSAWTPDGSRLAFVTGPYDPMQVESSVTDTFEVSVLDVAAGTPPQQVFSVEGPAPDVTWSPDGRSLAVLGREQEAACGCGRQGTLTVLDTLTGASRTVAPDATFAEWSPVDPSTFAWGNLTSLTIETDGVPRIVEPPMVKADKGRKPASWNGFMGWSPDGRYLGFGYPRLMTVDTTNDRTRVILSESDDLSLISTDWWR